MYMYVVCRNSSMRGGMDPSLSVKCIGWTCEMHCWAVWQPEYQVGNSTDRKILLKILPKNPKGFNFGWILDGIFIRIFCQLNRHPVHQMAEHLNKTSPSPNRYIHGMPVSRKCVLMATLSIYLGLSPEFW